MGVGRRLLRAVVPAAAIVALAVRASLPLSAQSPAGPSQPTAPGWVFTPGIAVAETWDNNVLLSTEGSGSEGDFFTAVSPQAALGFRGRLSTFQLDYRGTYQLYQELTELNAFDQRLTVQYRHRLSPTVTFIAKNSLSRSPTTDEADVTNLVFRRQGVVMDDFRAGIEARLSKRTTVSSDYTFQWLKFGDTGVPSPVEALERGGHAHGAVAQIDHVLSPRVTVGGEYEIRHAIVDKLREYDLQNALATADWRIDQRLTLSGGAGYSWLATGRAIGSQAAPAFRVSLSRSGARLAWHVGYRRSFMPSFGFGGTFENQEFEAGVFGPIARRLDWSASTSVREADPLRTSELGLRTIWARSSLSYLATRWMRVEGFFVAAFQDSRRPGGQVNRSRAGIQVVASTRTRIR
jgi:hypothetical protein